MSLLVFVILLLASPLLFTTLSAYASEQYLVADPDGNTLSIITPAGARTEIYHFSSQTTHGAYDVTLDASGNYIVIEVRELETDILSKVTPSGEYTVIYTFPVYTSPSGVKVDPSGNYIVTERNKQILSKITPAGTRTVLYNFTGENITPSDVTIDASGNYIVTQSSPAAISKITPAGIRTAVYNYTQSNPNMIEIDSAGNYIITETTLGILSKITPAGTRTVLYDFNAIETYTRPIGVAIDPSGNYIVTTEMTSGIGHLGPATVSRVTPAGVRTVIYTGVGVAGSGLGGVVYLALPPFAVTLSNPSEITETSMKLSWTACSDSDFKNYTVYMSTDQGSLGTPITTITNNATISYTATNLSPDTAYYFKVRVYDAGNLYVDSNQLTGKTSTATAPLPILPIALVLVAVIVAIGVFFILRMRKH